MHIITPTTIESIAWEGLLEPLPAMMSGGHPRRPIAAIGRPKIWPVAEALQNVVGQPWTPPLEDAEFWLIGLACTLREPPGPPQITDATLTLYLRPRDGSAPADSVYAYSLFPERLGIESKAEFRAGLEPTLTFGPAVEIAAGKLGTTIQYRKVFPAIQAYDVGKPAPYWVFRPHAAQPLDGCQHVYAVVAVRGANSQAGTGGAHALVTLIATVDTKWGVFKVAPPESARSKLSFTIP